MITLYDFNALNEEGKARAVFSDAIFLDDRVDMGLTVQLYRLNNFYVEVFYDAVANKITKYHAFNAVGQLVNYLRN